MRSLMFALAITVITILISSIPGAAGGWDVGYPPVVCDRYPPSYPRGWELMLRPRCGFYAPYPYYAYRRYAVGPYPYYRYRAYGHHHRPYLRPGWWW
jgi:hypothetical protein